MFKNIKEWGKCFKLVKTEFNSKKILIEKFRNGKQTPKEEKAVRKN